MQKGFELRVDHNADNGLVDGLLAAAEVTAALAAWSSGQYPEVARVPNLNRRKALLQLPPGKPFLLAMPTDTTFNQGRFIGLEEFLKQWKKI